MTPLMSMSNFGTRRSVSWRTMACVAAILLAGSALGLVSALGELIPIALALGLLTGMFLLAVPVWTLFLVITLGLTSGAVLSYLGGPALKVSWVPVLLSFLLLPSAVLALLDRPKLPVFMRVFAAFTVLALLSSAADWHGAGQFASGFKRYFAMAGVMLGLVVLPMANADMARLRFLIGTIALLQLPFVLWEYIFLVPLKNAVSPTKPAIDIVAGTFGANLLVGSPNAEMATFMLAVTAYAWLQWKHRLLTGRRLAAVVLVALPCLLLGSVRVLAVMFPLTAIIVYWREIAQRPGRYLPVLGAIAVLSVAVGLLLFTDDGGDWRSNLASVIRYNFEQEGYGPLALNRSTVLQFWMQQNARDPVGFLFGHGLGSSFNAVDGGTFSGQVAMQFPGYGIGLTSAAILLWDTGAVGLGLFLAMFVSAWVEAWAAYRRTRDAQQKVVFAWAQACVALFILHIFYNPSMLNIFPFQLVVALVMGMLGRALMVQSGVALTRAPPQQGS